MNISDYRGEEEYDYVEYNNYGRPPRRRPSPHHFPTSGDYRNGMLNPNYATSGIHRSRSTGHAPAPTINVYNRMDQEGSPYPQPYPQAPPPQFVGMPYPVDSRRASPRASPEGAPRRGRSRLSDTIDSELAEMALEHRYRSHSRSSRYSPDRRAEWELARKNEELKDISRERQRKLEEERFRNQMKLDQLEEERRREREEDEREKRERRAVEKWEAQQRDEKDKQKRAVESWEVQQRDEKEKQKRAVEKWEIEQREDKERQKRAVQKWEADLREQKDEEKRLKEKLEREAWAAKEKEKAEEERIKRKIEQDARDKKEREEALAREIKQKEREAKERQEEEERKVMQKLKDQMEKKKRDEADAEKKFQDEMRARLAGLGYTQQHIDLLVDKEKAQKFKHSMETKRERELSGDRLPMDVFRGPRAPVYPKVHRDYLAIETLKYYDLPWEYDRANPDYIIILRDMGKRETDLLFEHTSRLRTGKLLLEPKKEKPQLAMYRKRSRSRTGGQEIGVFRMS